MRYQWLPERQDRSGVYAAASYHMKGDGDETTTDATLALIFSTRESCQLWCDENPLPKFAPTEHGFDR